MTRLKIKIYPVCSVSLSSAARLEAAPDTWQLLPAAAVDGSGVFLGQLLNNPTNAVPLLQLAPAPRWGQTNILTREQIIELARHHFSALDTTNWSGPSAISLTRRSRQLLDFQLTELLRRCSSTRNTSEHGELDVRLSKPWTAVAVPDDDLELHLTDLPSNGLLPNSLVGFDIWCGKELIASYRVEIQAKLWREVPVARSPLQRGQLLREADIAMERRDVLTHHEAYLNMATADPTSELCENISVGQPVLQHCVRLSPHHPPRTNSGRHLRRRFPAYFPES